MIGPKVTTHRSCFDCEVCVSESYRVQSDSGKYVYCTHPSLAERRRIGDTSWETPDWCPAAITAAPQFIAPKVDDAMCERVWDAVFRKVVSNEVMAELRHAALFLDAWRAELGPQLGLVELREPVDTDCERMWMRYDHDAPMFASPALFGRPMFAAVSKWLKGEL